MKTQKPYETRNFIEDLESQNKIRNRNLTAKGRGVPPTLGFSKQRYKKNMEQQKKRGGKRPGAGRKKTTVKSYAFHAPKEVYDILEAVEGSKSDFICKCIIKAAQLP